MRVSPRASAALWAGRPRSQGANPLQAPYAKRLSARAPTYPYIPIQTRERGRGETDNHHAIIPQILAPSRQIPLASAICQHALTTSD